MSRVRDEMDRIWGRFFRDWTLAEPLRERAEQWAPAVEVSETAGEIIFNAEIPGMDPKDVDISLQNNMLTIRGERKQEKKKEEENFYQIEPSYGAFSRSIRLPADVDADKVDAACKNGVLSVRMPKGREAGTKKSKPNLYDKRY